MMTPNAPANCVCMKERGRARCWYPDPHRGSAATTPTCAFSTLVVKVHPPRSSMRTVGGSGRGRPVSAPHPLPFAVVYISCPNTLAPYAGVPNSASARRGSGVGGEVVDESRTTAAPRGAAAHAVG